MSLISVSRTTTDALASADDHRVPVGCPRRGVIRRLVVMQATGTLEGFEYTVYESAVAFAANGSLATGAELYKVGPKVTVAAPNATGADNVCFGLDLPYENGDLDDPRADRRYALHLLLRPTGTGNKTFKVVLGVENPSF